MTHTVLGPAFDVPTPEGARPLAYAEIARQIADGAVVGWFQGRMEFGPRALSHRSLLADPRART